MLTLNNTSTGTYLLSVHIFYKGYEDFSTFRCFNCHRNVTQIVVHTCLLYESRFGNRMRYNKKLNQNSEYKK